jgi:hypothetical protein
MDASYFLSVAVAAKHFTGGFSTHRQAGVRKARDRTDCFPKAIAASVLPSCLAVLTATAEGAGRLIVAGQAKAAAPNQWLHVPSIGKWTN